MLFTSDLKLVSRVLGKSLGAIVHFEDVPLTMDTLKEPREKYHSWKTDEEHPPTSFMDLFYRGVEKSESYFHIIYNYIYKNIDEISLLGNKNFDTGCEEEIEYLHHCNEFIEKYLK